MRSILFLSQFVGMLASAVRLNEFAMFVFVGCECLLPEEETTELYSVFQRDAGLKYQLFDWYMLDEATFVERARKIAGSAHEEALGNSTGSLLQTYMDNLRRQGLSEAQVTTHLLKKYYKSLRSKTAMHKIKEEDDEYED
jgi:hypothetical protein